jgi:hypothetical protein
MGSWAEEIAAQVNVGGVRFQAARGRVREALDDAGAASRIEGFVRLLFE